MPVAITLETTLLAIRAVTNEQGIPPPILATGSVYYGAAKQMIEQYAPKAPSAVQDSAMVRLVGWMWDSPISDPYQNKAMTSSGAASILAQWRTHSIGIISDSDDDSSPSKGIPADFSEFSGRLISNEAKINSNTGRIVTLESVPASPSQPTGEGDDAYDWATVGNTEIIPSDKLPAVAVPSGTYVLPAAASGVRGGVQAVTNSIIDTGTSTGIFGWAISHIKKLIKSGVSDWAEATNTDAIPAEKLTNAPAGTSTGGGDAVPIIKNLHESPSYSSSDYVGRTPCYES